MLIISVASRLWNPQDPRPAGPVSVSAFASTSLSLSLSPLFLSLPLFSCLLVFVSFCLLLYLYLSPSHSWFLSVSVSLWSPALVKLSREMRNRRVARLCMKSLHLPWRLAICCEGEVFTHDHTSVF